MSLPGKGWEGHICPTILTLWWHHLEHHESGGSKKTYSIAVRGHELLKCVE